MQSITQETVFKLLPARKADSSKYTHGRVLAVCGSLPYRGAAALSVQGALRSGAGLVTLAAPEAVIQSVAAQTPEAVFLPLPCADAELAQAAQKASCLLTGCGLPENEETKRQTLALLQGRTAPAVLDAGALCSLAGLTPQTPPCPLILTPHAGEMAKLTGLPREQIEQNAAQTAAEYAVRWGCTVVLKGHRTVVADANGEVWQNTTGNAGLARGGSGDILAGLTAGLCAQGLRPAHAAVCGVWLHGAAADLCSARHSMRGMLPSDIFAYLQQIFLQQEQASQI